MSILHTNSYEKLPLNCGNFAIFSKRFNNSNRLLRLQLFKRQALDSDIAGERCQLLTNGLIKSGQPEAGINLRHRCKDKGALVSTRMRKLKFWMIKYQAPPANQVKVECSGRVPAAASDATKVLFNGVKNFKKAQRANAVFHMHLDHGVYKVGGVWRAVYRPAAKEG